MVLPNINLISITQRRITRLTDKRCNWIESINPQNISSNCKMRTTAWIYWDGVSTHCWFGAYILFTTTHRKWHHSGLECGRPLQYNILLTNEIVIGNSKVILKCNAISTLNTWGGWQFSVVKEGVYSPYDFVAGAKLIVTKSQSLICSNLVHSYWGIC